MATYNIRHGARPGRPVSNRAMAAAVAGLGADVVALQEVDRRVVRSWFADQAAVAARRGGLAAHFAPARGLGPGGRYGNALLVRGRTLRTEVMALPGGGEARVAVFASVVTGDSRLTVVSTHLQNRAAGADTAPRQLDALLAHLENWPTPWCVMGDLNLRDAAVLPALGAAGLRAAPTGPTFPADAPRVRIDWIAARGVEIVDAEVVEARASDHRAVVATLRFPHDGHGAADASAEAT